MRFMVIATVAAASYLILVRCWAQDANSHEEIEQRFAVANTTHDGCLTLQQAKDAGLKAVVRSFAEIDKARRGCITLAQIRQFRTRLSSTFALANTTHDGCLTRQQAIDGGLRRVVRDFDEIDTQKRGCVTLEQVKRFAPPRFASIR